MLDTLALVGSGEFTPAMEAVDRDLLAATSRRRPRVAIVPTASWPDGEEVFLGWATRGDAHFTGLGAEVEQVLLRDRAGADDPSIVAALAEADLIYFSGGKPGYLLDALEGSMAGAVIMAAPARGAVVAGCSAGAMVMAGSAVRVGRTRFLQLPIGWREGLGLVPGVAVIPHYDQFPETLSAAVAIAAPPGVQLLGIDEETAMVGAGTNWRVAGRGRVTVWTGHHRVRHGSGESFELGAPPTP